MIVEDIVHGKLVYFIGAIDNIDVINIDKEFYLTRTDLNGNFLPGIEGLETVVQDANGNKIGGLDYEKTGKPATKKAGYSVSTFHSYSERYSVTENVKLAFERLLENNIISAKGVKEYFYVLTSFDGLTNKVIYLGILSNKEKAIDAKAILEYLKLRNIKNAS